MSLLLVLFTLIVAAVLFLYPPLEPAYGLWAQWVILALLALSLVLQLVLRFRGRRGDHFAADENRAPPAGPSPSIETAVEAGVVKFLARLQEKGRLVDFAMDDITPYSNEQIGAAARVVHQGCREVLQESFEIRPVHAGEERETVTLSAEYDASAYRLVGKVPERPPYRGTLLHRGWKTTRVSLPRVTEPAQRASAREVIAPAEVEIE